MRIAITADPMLPVPPEHYGGIERVISMLVEGLVDRGHDVTLFAHRDSNVPCRLVPYSTQNGQSPLGEVRNALSISRLALDRPDILHSFGRLAYLTALLPLSVPKIMSYQRKPTLSRIRYAAAIAQSGSLVFTGCSQHIAAQIRPAATAYTIHNGVPMEKYDFQASVSDDAPLFFLGRIARIKGVHTAIEIARRTDRRLIIAGNVPDSQKGESYFEAEIKPELDGDQIRFIGPVCDEEKNRYLGQAAALLMPIEWEEPFGIVMAEAMACGTPVIGRRRGGVPEVIKSGETGFLFDTIDEAVEAVENIDAIDRQACWERCDRLFSAQSLVDAYETLYTRFTNGMAPERLVDERIEKQEKAHSKEN